MFGITGPMIKSSQSDIGSFVRSAAYELEQGYNDLKTFVNMGLVKFPLIDLETQKWATGRKQANAVQRERLSEETLILVMRQSDLGYNFLRRLRGQMKSCPA